MYRLKNRFTGEFKTFETWSDLDHANLDVRTWGRPEFIEPNIVGSMDLTSDGSIPTAYIPRVFINPTLWRVNVPICKDSDLEGVYLYGSCFTYMKPYRRV